MLTEPGWLCLPDLRAEETQSSGWNRMVRGGKAIIQALLSVRRNLSKLSRLTPLGRRCLGEDVSTRPKWMCFFLVSGDKTSSCDNRPSCPTGEGARDES